MNRLTEHYRLLLGLDSSWEVSEVALSLDEQRVDISLTHSGGKVTCPECGAACSIADHAPERTWRHLDTMQFETRLHAATPRANCGRGVKTIAVPWADKHSRFTWLFKALAIGVLEACGNVHQAAKLLRLDWDSAHRIMERAVERGLERRQVDALPYVGMDEKSFGRGHDYISLLIDLEGSRVLEVTEGRNEAAAQTAWNSLGTEAATQVQAVAVDMWPAYAKAATDHAPQAEIVHDRFHISKQLNEAVDQVRRSEHKALKQTGDESLTGSKQLWLYNPENLNEDQWLRFKPLQQLELKTARAFANFRTRILFYCGKLNVLPTHVANH